MKKEAKFKPRPDQIDYTNIRWAPVIDCVVVYKGKLLLVQRSKGMKLYPEYWNGISGFLDDNKSLEDKVQEELLEELGLSAQSIKYFLRGQVFERDETKYKKTWIKHPMLVEVKTDKIKLDWEAQNYEWVTPKEALTYKLLPGFEQVLSSFF